MTDKLITMSMNKIAELVLISSEASYRAAQDGVSWQDMKDDIVNAMLTTVVELSDEEVDNLLKGCHDSH